MGLIRGIGIVAISTFLFLSLFVGVLFLNLSNALEYNSLQTNSLVFLENVVKNNTEINTAISENIQFIQLYCSNNTNYILNFENYTLDIPCTNNITSDFIIQEGVKDIFSQVYFKNYSCSFLQCFKEQELPLFLISINTYNLLNKYFYLSILLSFILFIALFFTVKSKSSSLIILGGLLIIPAIVSFSFSSLPKLFSEPLISQALNIFFNESHSIGIKLVIFSLFLILAGILIKVFKLGLHLEQFIEKMKNNSSNNNGLNDIKPASSSKKQDLNKKQ